jgi:hypothetical protein
MNKSTAVLILHCSLFVTLVVCSLSSPFLQLWQPKFFNQLFFPVYASLVLVTALGWLPRFGGCALTTWENNLRKRENRQPYSDTFLVHYITLWTGWSVPKNAITAVLVGLMLVPVLVWVLWSGFLF